MKARELVGPRSPERARSDIMSESYTFRYLNADGSVNGFKTMSCTGREDAKGTASRWMPKNAASLEIWCGDKLISELGSIQPEHSDRKEDFLDHKMSSIPIVGH
jgi:hypothetical protein